MFFTFWQNNSGGSFDRDDSVDDYVIIEANGWERANRIAEEVGIYFNGCDAGIDCDCCGDRWYPQWDDGEGETEPTIYSEQDMAQHRVIIYYADGRVVHHKGKGR